MRGSRGSTVGGGCVVKPPLTLQLEDTNTQGFSSYSNIYSFKYLLETKNSWLGRLGHPKVGPCWNLVFEVKNRLGKVFENWLLVCFLLRYCKRVVLNNLPQTEQCPQIQFTSVLLFEMHYFLPMRSAIHINNLLKLKIMILCKHFFKTTWQITWKNFNCLG